VQKVVAVVLAAGKGTRMKSALPKVLHRVCGRYMVEHVIEAARQAGAERIIAVIGHGAEQVTRALGDRVDYVNQVQQMGTGHAVMVAQPAIKPDEEVVMVLCGDTPLITGDTLRRLLEQHLSGQAVVTILTSLYKDPHGYGRIVRDAQGLVAEIVEEKDATPEQRQIPEINTGIYCFDRAQLFKALSEIAPINAQGEYYLTDCVTVINRSGGKVETVAAAEEETLGINCRVQQAQAEKILRWRLVEELMIGGVTIIDPGSTFIDSGVVVGPDTVIFPFTIIQGGTSIGSGCEIGPGTRITESQIGNGTAIWNSMVVDSRIGDDCTVGPFAYLRPQTVLEAGVKVGDFVEIKKSTIGQGSKVPHLSYVGDAVVGKGVNIGAGTITCNYDGFRKSETVIDDYAFVGSNTNLVAPVRVGEGAVIGAGSTITHEIPAGALAVARTRQKNIDKWAKRKRESMDKKPGAEEDKSSKLND